MYAGRSLTFMIRSHQSIGRRSVSALSTFLKYWSNKPVGLHSLIINQNLLNNSIMLGRRGSSCDTSVLETAKKSAAYQAVDDHIEDGMIIGIGSGSTVVYAVERIAERALTEAMKLTCIPTSMQAKDLIIHNRLPLSDLDVHYQIDVTIDGCDECDRNLNLIKGGGGCLLQEKIVAAASKKLVIVADYTKDSTFLGENWKKGIPLEVSQIGWKVVVEKLNRFSKSEGGHSILRQAMKKMGPVVTDNSNFLIDFQVGNTFKDSKKTPREIETWLKTIPGILETGLFVDMANQAYFGQADGTVKKTDEITREPNYF